MTDEVCVIVPVGFSAGSYRAAIQSFRKFYPRTCVFIAGNIAKKTVADEIERFAAQDSQVTNTHFFPPKISYGDMLHETINKIHHQFIFFMDHAAQTRSGRFLEEMTKLLASSEKIYGTGKLLFIERRGKEAAVLDERFMMIKRKEYLQLSPFEGKRNVMLKNFLDAAAHGYEVRNFPIQQYLSFKQYASSSIANRISSIVEKFRS